MNDTTTNKIVFYLNSAGTTIERIELEPRLHRYIEPMLAMLQRSFRISNWSALRFLCELENEKIYRDYRRDEVPCPPVNANETANRKTR